MQTGDVDFSGSGVPGTPLRVGGLWAMWDNSDTEGWPGGRPGTTSKDVLVTVVGKLRGPGSARQNRGETYPPDWAEIARSYKDSVGWVCQRCGHLHDPCAGYTLTVHHLDHDPSNCAPDNLVALCQRCHLWLQHRSLLQFVFWW